MGIQIVTSVKVDEDLWKKAKVRAINEGITLNTLVEQAITTRLAKDESQEKRR